MNAPNSCTGTPPTAGWNARGVICCAPAEVGATALEVRPKEARAAKNLEKHHLGLGGLQPVEIPQNGQSFLWKSLQKKGRYLEKLGE
jgi:hypothetical protein